MLDLENKQARQFMLLKQGLLGAYKFTGRKGALEYIKQAGCIQFDPVDVCGKNAELTLQSRVGGFTKDMLAELLYNDRELFDYPDKQLSVIPAEYWAYFTRFRNAARQNLEKYPEIKEHIGKFREYIGEHGAVSSGDFKLEGSTSWWSGINWSAGNKLSRSVLEQMYGTGDLIVHHKKGARRYYDLAEKHIPADLLNAPDPLPDDFEHQKWRVLRRIGAVGLIWNRPSDAWLNIWGLTNEIRGKIFSALLDEAEITAVNVGGRVLYCRSGDTPLIEAVMQNPEPEARCEFIAPLDPFMWDRKLIKALFGFEYSWEIYTPPAKRRYGVYVLPIVYGDRFIGRIEPACDRRNKTLAIKNIWYERDVKQTKKLQSEVDKCVKRFAEFNGCASV